MLKCSAISGFSNSAAGYLNHRNDMPFVKDTYKSISVVIKTVTDLSKVKPNIVIIDVTEIEVETLLHAEYVLIELYLVADLLMQTHVRDKSINYIP
ncbi:hypothetical protein CEXT_745101 [Caerostris extrusa]|uniref:Uncharacterized protein n=1 Tax=Caerostris extrusa TaxID=172846 RepID=A0AAV4MU17_CAEEX|nr:hypothetical protein CEXT_745101 [Caerostris extrusa]